MRLNTCASQRENDFMATMYILLSQMPVVVVVVVFFVSFRGRGFEPSSSV